MKYKIRKSTLEDIYGVQEAHKRSIIEMCSGDYSREQIEKYADINYSKEIWEKSVTSEFLLVVEANDKIEGFCHAKININGEAHIVGLYLTKAIAGKGIGSEIFEMAMEYLKKYNPPKIYLTGTITAKGFYEKMGFLVVEKRQISIRGAMLDCFNMEKIID